MDRLRLTLDVINVSFKVKDSVRYWGLEFRIASEDYNRPDYWFQLKTEPLGSSFRSKSEPRLPYVLLIL